MSRLEKMINEVCSEKVEYKRIDEICNISRGRVMSKEYIRDNQGDFPVYSSQTENDGKLGMISSYDYEGEYITWTTDGANAGSVFYRKGKFNITNVCGLLECTRTDVYTKFLYYVLNSVAKNYVNKGMGNPKLMSNVMGKIYIPVPPSQIQYEIISILDAFTELIAELTTELMERKRQYEYCLQKLLKFSDASIKYEAIGSCCTIEKGKTPIQKAVAGLYPLVTTTVNRQTSNSYQFDCSAVCVPLISSRGHGVASISYIYHQEGKFALGNILCAIIPNDPNRISARFLKYYLFYYKDILLVPLMRGGANVSLPIDALRNVKVPIPPLHIQEYIVRVCDKFEKYIFDLLPAEIEARQKQYEYYRDKLLAFKEIPTAEALVAATKEDFK